MRHPRIQVELEAPVEVGPGESLTVELQRFTEEGQIRKLVRRRVRLEVDDAGQFALHMDPDLHVSGELRIYVVEGL